MNANTLPKLHGVIAHRGASAKAPENTMAAFRQAYYDGADAIELDIVRSQNGSFLVMHDDTVDRTTDGSGAISDLDDEEIAKLDAGAWFSPTFSGESVPHLGEVLDWAQGRLHVDIEVKKSTAKSSTTEELASTIRQHGAEQNVTVTSFDREFVEGIKEVDQEIPTGLLLSARGAFKSSARGGALGAGLGLALGTLATGHPLIAAGTTLAGGLGGALVGRHRAIGKAKEVVRETSADQIAPHWFIASKGLMATAEEAGVGVLPYTVNSTRRGNKLLNRGVNGLITDHPDRFATAKPESERSKRWADQVADGLSQMPATQVQASPEGITLRTTEPAVGESLRELLRQETRGIPIMVDYQPPSSDEETEDFQRKFRVLATSLPGATALTAPEGTDRATLVVMREQDRDFAEAVLKPKVDGRSLEFLTKKRLGA